ncbi:lytic transglycosylase domain-containing protein [Lichenibacterium dinghuense]|uniref:lytic transglycosylase domain-containing protein n=1 Tax=Lichenibacterium dinghuense TaxID=2895977 RepID=UPI001F30535B|nr:lytic transglycosylase domain-containing protein [Lichenibacterium sp. 6Y81]
MRPRILRLALAASLAAAPLASAPSLAVPTPAGGETVAEAMCRLITSAADGRHLPVGFLTRLIWQESAFRAEATSPAGAQGIAQFMPGTAAERGLADPFDPEQAVPASAHLLSDLAAEFGNLGLAAAAYNAGARRVSDWLAGRGGLPSETRNYVERITGRSAEDWAADAKAHETHDLAVEPQTCLQLASTLRTAPRRAGTIAAIEAPFAPWGVQLAGNFSKSLALAAFARARAKLAGVIGDARPMVIGTRLRTRGTRAFYRVRVPAPTRQAADDLCRRIQAAQGACVTLRS